jgi:hypothetical protein
MFASGSKLDRSMVSVPTYFWQPINGQHQLLADLKKQRFCINLGGNLCCDRTYGGMCR